MRAWLVLLIACRYTGEYPCASDDHCRRGDEVGYCEHTGYCTFTDLTCPTQRRYIEHAPDELANECLTDVVTGRVRIYQLSNAADFTPVVTERIPTAAEIALDVELDTGNNAFIDYRDSDGT